MRLWRDYFILLSILSLSLNAQDTMRIFGYVTDFKGNSVENATVRVKDKKFNNLFECVTDRNGYYSLTIPKKPS